MVFQPWSIHSSVDCSLEGSEKRKMQLLAGKNAWTRRKSPVKYPIFHVTSDMREKKIEKMSSKPSGFLCCPYFYEMRRVMMRTSASHTLRLIVRGNASVCVRRASRACENCTDRSQVRKTFLYFYHLLYCLCILLPLSVRAELKMHHWFRPNSKSLIVQVEYSFTFTVRVLILFQAGNL